jgi:hypothetical protein
MSRLGKTRSSALIVSIAALTTIFNVSEAPKPPFPMHIRIASTHTTHTHKDIHRKTETPSDDPGVPVSYPKKSLFGYETGMSLRSETTCSREHQLHCATICTCTHEQTHTNITSSTSYIREESSGSCVPAGAPVNECVCYACVFERIPDPPVLTPRRIYDASPVS